VTDVPLNRPFGENCSFSLTHVSLSSSRAYFLTNPLLF
jgi:hypothetical protein